MPKLADELWSAFQTLTCYDRQVKVAVLDQLLDRSHFDILSKFRVANENVAIETVMSPKLHSMMAKRNQYRLTVIANLQNNVLIEKEIEIINVFFFLWTLTYNRMSTSYRPSFLPFF